MKIQLSSTLPLTPVQLDARHTAPKRAVGQLYGLEDGREYRTAVYQFRHTGDDQIHYQVDPGERVYLDSEGKVIEQTAAVAQTGESLEWVVHSDALTYKPYAFEVMNAMSKLVGDWDGVDYQTPSGERQLDTAVHATLQVVDACVCNKFGLWVMVNLVGDKALTAPVSSQANRQLGWVPL